MPRIVTNGTIANGSAAISGGWSDSPDPNPRYGRFPANFIHDGSADVLALFPESESKATSNGNGRYSPDPYGEKTGGYFGDLNAQNSYSDQGSAARFFYCAKASPGERDHGLAGFYWQRDPGRPSGYKRITADQYERLPANERAAGNIHLTVKPLELMGYLCRLVTPPGGKVLDIFAGSGTTGLGAILEGFQPILIERDPDYVQIARARLEWAQTAAKNAAGDYQLTQQEAAAGMRPLFADW